MAINFLHYVFAPLQTFIVVQKILIIFALVQKISAPFQTDSMVQKSCNLLCNLPTLIIFLIIIIITIN